MCSSSSACSSPSWSAPSAETGSRRACAALGHLLQGERAGHDDAEDHRGDEVEHDVATAVRTSTTASPRVERSTARTLETSTIRTAVAMSTPARAASGIRRHGRARARARPPAAARAVDDRGQAGAGAGPDVDRGPGDGGGGRDAAESGQARLARPWPNSSRSGSWRSPTLIAVGHRGRQQALQRGRARRPRRAGIASTRSVGPGHVGQRRRGQAGGQRADPGRRPRPATARPRWRRPRPAATPGMPGRQREPTSSMAAATAAAMAGGRPRAGRRPLAATASAATATHLLALGRHAQRGGHLLQGDDHRDADGEALDDGQRDVAHVAAQRRRRPATSRIAPAMQPDDEHAVGPVRGRRSGPAPRSWRRSGPRPAGCCRRTRRRRSRPRWR